METPLFGAGPIFYEERLRDSAEYIAFILIFDSMKIEKQIVKSSKKLYYFHHHEKVSWPYE